MADIDITRYNDGDDFGETELDAIVNTLETFFNDTRISDDNLASEGISGTKIKAATINNAKLASDSVATANFIDDSVDATKLASDIAGTGLSQASSGALDVNVDDSTIAISSDTVIVKDSGIDSTQLAASSVTTDKLADDSVTSAKQASRTYAGQLVSFS